MRRSCRIVPAGLAVLVGLLIAPGLGTGDAEAGTAPPKVIQLSYSQSSDQGDSLLAFARRTDSLRFAIHYRGAEASAPARRSSTFDTDLDGAASRGWKPKPEQGGREVKRLIRESLAERGEARVRTRAKRDGLLDDHRWVLVLSKCSQEPPLYPVDCEVARSGRHFRAGSG
jgi:hypothetical protein